MLWTLFSNRKKENRIQLLSVVLIVMILLKTALGLLHYWHLQRREVLSTFEFSPVPSDDICQHCHGNPHIKSCNSSFKTICSKNSKNYTIHQQQSTSFIKAQIFLKYSKLFCSIQCISKHTKSDKVRHWTEGSGSHHVVTKDTGNSLEIFRRCQIWLIILLKWVKILLDWPKFWFVRIHWIIHSGFSIYTI